MRYEKGGTGDITGEASREEGRKEQVDSKEEVM